jgi:GxxExxY protein
MNPDNTRLDPLTDLVLGAVFEVSNKLGAGFLEKVYQRALLRELNLRGVNAKTEVSFEVLYKGRPLGHYFADLIVEGGVEMRPVSQLSPSVRPDSMPSSQLPEAEGGMETNRPRLSSESADRRLPADEPDLIPAVRERRPHPFD